MSELPEKKSIQPSAWNRLPHDSISNIKFESVKGLLFFQLEGKAYHVIPIKQFIPLCEALSEICNKTPK